MVGVFQQRFFGTLKSEFFHPNEFADVDQLKRGLHRYIRYYNERRATSVLNGLSPVQYRIQHAQRERIVGLIGL